MSLRTWVNRLRVARKIAGSWTLGSSLCLNIYTTFFSPIVWASQTQVCWLAVRLAVVSLLLQCRQILDVFPSILVSSLVPQPYVRAIEPNSSFDKGPWRKAAPWSLIFQRAMEEAQRISGHVVYYKSNICCCLKRARWARLLCTMAWH